jgi:hypothetical protein
MYRMPTEANPYVHKAIRYQHTALANGRNCPATASAVYFPQKGCRVEGEAMLGPMQSNCPE